jgi:acetylornithine/N-succinyldiaminopimelate aminotransferase
MDKAGTEALMDITQRPDFTMVEGHGSWLIDDSGKRYLDFVQGWAVNCLGHSPEIIQEALRKQAATLINCSPAFYNQPMKELAALLTKLTGLHKVFFANSGAEANEGAIKLARKWGSKFRGGAFEIVTTKLSFHGRTLATMAASGKPQFETLFEPKVPGFIKVPFDDPGALENAISEKTVAVMLEPIQGEAGVIVSSPGFLQFVRTITKQRGILLILDEVQTGVGRTGKLFGREHADILPDIMTLGKGLGGGVPLAALIAHRDVSCFEHGDQGGTFNGSALISAVGCAVMKEVSRPEFLAYVEEAGSYLQDRLSQLSKKHGLGEVRGKGLLVALDLGREIATELVKECLERGLLLNAPNPRTLRFMPALNVSLDEIDQMTDTLDLVLQKQLAPLSAEKHILLSKNQGCTDR